ncbi:hypothetical protein U9M48_027187, partial [Paspalum notatum var. saurae]
MNVSEKQVRHWDFLEMVETPTIIGPKLQCMIFNWTPRKALTKKADLWEGQADLVGCHSPPASQAIGVYQFNSLGPIEFTSAVVIGQLLAAQVYASNRYDIGSLATP